MLAFVLPVITTYANAFNLSSTIINTKVIAVDFRTILDFFCHLCTMIERFLIRYKCHSNLETKHIILVYGETRNY